MIAMLAGLLLGGELVNVRPQGDALLQAFIDATTRPLSGGLEDEVEKQTASTWRVSAWFGLAKSIVPGEIVMCEQPEL